MKRQHPINPNLFWCPKCKTYKSREAFTPRYDGPTPVRGYCKKCFRLNYYIPRPPRKIICSICGNEFISHHAIKYCGEKCKQKGRSKVQKELYRRNINPPRIEKRLCKWCGENFEVQMGVGLYDHGRGCVKGRQKKYCSRECRIRENREKAKFGHIKNCVICGTTFYGRHDGKICSKDCLHILTSQNASNRFQDKEKVHLNHTLRRRRMEEKERKNLTNHEMRKRIHIQYGISMKDVSPSLIKLRREQTVIHRTLNNLKKEVNL